MRAPFQPENQLANDQAVQDQRKAIEAVQTQFLERFHSYRKPEIIVFPAGLTPYFTIFADRSDLEFLFKDVSVSAIYEDNFNSKYFALGLLDVLPENTSPATPNSVEPNEVTCQPECNEIQARIDQEKFVVVTANLRTKVLISIAPDLDQATLFRQQTAVRFAHARLLEQTKDASGIEPLIARPYLPEFVLRIDRAGLETLRKLTNLVIRIQAYQTITSSLQTSSMADGNVKMNRPTACPVSGNVAGWNIYDEYLFLWGQPPVAPLEYATVHFHSPIHGPSYM